MHPTLEHSIRSPFLIKDWLTDLIIHGFMTFHFSICLINRFTLGKYHRKGAVSKCEGNVVTEGLDGLAIAGEAIMAP